MVTAGNKANHLSLDKHTKKNIMIIINIPFLASTHVSLFSSEQFIKILSFHKYKSLLHPQVLYQREIIFRLEYALFDFLPVCFCW